jgi:hypothetical protein
MVPLWQQAIYTRLSQEMEAKMRVILVALAILLGGVSAAQACIQSAISDPDFTEVCIASICTRVQHVDLVERSVKKQEEELSALLQRPYDESIPITELPLDDPDRSEDPALGNIYWSTDRGDRDVALIDKTHLWSRSCEITARWDGAVFQVSARSL